MNKKERKLLAGIVAEMKHKRDTVPELMDYADIILRQFSCLDEEMYSANEDALEDSIVDRIRSYLRKVNNPLVLREYDNPAMISEFTENCYTILWDYLELAGTDVSVLSEKLYENDGIKNMIRSEEWRASVNYHNKGSEFTDWCTKQY